MCKRGRQCRAAAQQAAGLGTEGGAQCTWARAKRGCPCGCSSAALLQPFSRQARSGSVCISFQVPKILSSETLASYSHCNFKLS